MLSTNLSLFVGLLPFLSCLNVSSDYKSNPNFVFLRSDKKVVSNTNAVSTPRRTEPKLSLSEYHTTKSLNSPGMESHVISVNDKVTNESSVNVDVSVRTVDEETVPKTSTPVRSDLNIDPASGAVGFSPVRRRGTRSSSTLSSAESHIARRREKRVSFVDPLDVRVPLVGFEVMEQRAKFTVSKSARSTFYTFYFSLSKY